MEYLLHHLLRNSALAYPANEAVRMDDQALTYDQLERASNQLARALRSLGIERGDRVGIYVHKSLVSVISVFAIMKASAAYVPLDPNSPAKRLAYITRDCGIKVLLASGSNLEGLSALLAEGSAIQTIVLTGEIEGETPRFPRDVRVVSVDALMREQDSHHTLCETIENDLAYILYTSGSTGVPKGVMISHRTILTFIDWAVDQFALTSADRITSHAPLHFDLSTFDLYATVKAGGTIVLIPEGLAALPSKLADLLEQERISITYLVPSILSFMVNYGNLTGRDFSSLRSVLFAGEVFPIRYLRRLVEAVPHAEYYNLYGPTETNVCTFYKVREEDLLPERREAVPIGQACGNTEVFAVDESGGLIGEPGREGELWVRGSCVAQGYWGDRVKTERSFVQNPNNGLFTDLIYRTGDIVRLAPDGKNWLYVGRQDHMIKSRGYRIELGEIENALYRHKEVREAAAVAVPDDILGNRICAFVVTASGSALERSELERFCAAEVPKYMIPERIELCEAIPKTSTGKIDRRKLLASAEENLRKAIRHSRSGMSVDQLITD